MLTFTEYLKEISRGLTHAELKKIPVSKRTPQDERDLVDFKPAKKKTGIAHVTLKWSDNTTDKTKVKLTGPEHKWDEEAKEKAEQHLKNMKRGASALPHKPQPTGIHKVEVK